MGLKDFWQGLKGTLFYQKLTKHSPILLRVMFLLIAVLAFTGVMDRIADYALDDIWEYNSTFLDRSLKKSVGFTAAMIIPKAALATAETITFEPEAFIKVGGIQVGKMLEPANNIMDKVLKYMGYNIALTVAQKAILEFIRHFSLRVILCIGALFCVISYNRLSLTGRFGYLIIGLAALLYIVYPLSLYAAARAYEEQHAQTLFIYQEKVGALQEEAKEIHLDRSFKKLRKLEIRESIKQFEDSLDKSLALVRKWGAVLFKRAVDLFVDYLILFAIVPIASLGVCYMLLKLLLDWLQIEPKSIADSL